MTEVAAITEPNWFIDEGVPGVGDRPQWLPEKFKSTADMAKSYNELEKKFSTPPEEYDISKSRFFDKDFQPLKDSLQLAREKRVPKEVIDKMLDTFDKYIEPHHIDEGEELKKLGDKGEDRIKVVTNWAKANLSDDAFKALSSEVKSANGIKAIEELRSKMMSNTTVIPGGNDGGTGAPTVAEIQQEISTNLAKYKTDAKYRDDVSARLALAAKNSSYIDKTGA
jgi:hypothetical protein